MMQNTLNLHPDREISYRLYQGLRQRWPQLNEQTRIEYTNHREVYIQLAPAANIMDNVVRVAVSGWRRLKTWLFFREQIVYEGSKLVRLSASEYLDNPDNRWKYTVNLWRSAFNAPKYICWRSVGRLFHRRDWYSKGTEMQPNPVAVLSTPSRDVVQLERYGVQLSIGRRNEYQPEFHEIICGYYPARDTLFIYQR